MKRKIKSACGNVFHRMVSKARKKKQTGLMHNTGGVFHYIIKLRKIFLSNRAKENMVPCANTTRHDAIYKSSCQQPS